MFHYTLYIHFMRVHTHTHTNCAPAKSCSFSISGRLFTHTHTHTHNASAKSRSFSSSGRALEGSAHTHTYTHTTHTLLLLSPTWFSSSGRLPCMMHAVPRLAGRLTDFLPFWEMRVRPDQSFSTRGCHASPGEALKEPSYG